LTYLFLIRNKQFDSNLYVGVKNAQIPEVLKTKVQIFNGETTYSNQETKIGSKHIVKKSENSSKSIINLVQSRMLSSGLPFSDLDQLLKFEQVIENMEKKMVFGEYVNSLVPLFNIDLFPKRKIKSKIPQAKENNIQDIIPFHSIPSRNIISRRKK
jgi:hypothetical protein